MDGRQGCGAEVGGWMGECKMERCVGTGWTVEQRKYLMLSTVFGQFAIGLTSGLPLPE